MNGNLKIDINSCDRKMILITESTPFNKICKIYSLKNYITWKIKNYSEYLIKKLQAYFF